MKIKLNLTTSEYDPIDRTARAFGCTPEDVVYLAVDEYMTRLGTLGKSSGSDRVHFQADFETLQAQVLNAKSARKDNLPLWADSAESVHAYEGKPDDEPEKSTASMF
jgi:hypothetical protein